MNWRSENILRSFFRIFLLISILFLNCQLFSQTKAVKIKVQLLSDENSTAGIDIVNLVNEESTRSDINGEFTMSVSSGDLLIISGRNFEHKRYIVEEEDLTKETLKILLVLKPIELDETLVYTRAQLDAMAKGLTSSKVKVYTPAESKLRTAGDFKPIHLLGLLGGSLQIDPIINAITGKTSRMKDELEVERREIRMAYFEKEMGKEYFIEQLSIPEDDFQAFMFFIADDVKTFELLKAKDKNRARFEFSQSAVRFRNLNRTNQE